MSMEIVRIYIFFMAPLSPNNLRYDMLTLPYLSYKPIGNHVLLQFLLHLGKLFPKQSPSIQSSCQPIQFVPATYAVMWLLGNLQCYVLSCQSMKHQYKQECDKTNPFKGESAAKFCTHLKDAQQKGFTTTLRGGIWITKEKWKSVCFF